MNDTSQLFVAISVIVLYLALLATHRKIEKLAKAVDNLPSSKKSED